MFDSGAGIYVTESHGILSVMVLLPPEFNETYAVNNFLFIFIIENFL